MYALVCKCSVSARQFQRRHALRESAERRGEVLVVALAVEHEGCYAHLLRIVNRLVDAELLRDFYRRHVERVACHSAQRHRAAEIAAVILRRPAADLDRTVVDDGVRRIIRLQCCRKDEGLERRTWLALRHRRAVELIRAAAADHRLDVSRMRVDGDERHLRLLHAVAVRALHGHGMRGLFRRLLHRHVDRRVDLQAFLVDGVGAVSVNDLLRDIVDEVRARRILYLRLIDQRRLLLRRLACRRIVDVAVLLHLVEHDFLAFLRGVEVVERRIVVGTLRYAREHRALVEIEILDVLAEVRLRRRLHAVSALSEVDLIEIKFQNLLFRILALDLQREEDLLHLALDRPILCQIGVLRELLRDRRASLCNRPARDVGIDGAQDAARVDAHVLVETIVLDRDESVLQVLRNLRELYGFAVLRRMDVGDLVAVDVINMGGCRRAYILDEIFFRIHARRQEAAADADEHDENEDEETHESAHDLAAATFLLRRRLRIRLRC